MTLTTMELPQTDTRKYHHLTLPSNGLDVMLVQDTSAETSAAAVTVAAGQFQDPVDFPGLAHLVEHMVFLGSKDFPLENEYDQFVSTHGGHSNAYTDLELTCFYCNVKSGQLEGALARFGASLASPLFAANSLEREIQAVDSEHSNNRQSDFWRSNQLSHSLIGGRFQENTTHHLFAHFGTGNMDVLLPGDDDKPSRLEMLRQQVVAFYERYYKAAAMKLVILGPHSLEELEQWTEKYFGNIPAGEIVKEPLAALPEQPCMGIQWVPVRDSRTLTLQWILPELRSHYRSKPGHVLSHILGHEGPGTLLHVLKEEMHWAHELSADNISSMTSAFTILNLNIELTPTGLDNVPQIIEGVYKYISLMQDLPEWVYKEQEVTAELQFRFLSKTEPEDTVSQLAVNLQYYAPEHALSGPHKIYKHEPALVQKCLDCFTRENMFILLSSKDFTTDRVDPWYGTRFKVLNTDEIAPYINSETDADWLSMLRLPGPNDMLATNFELVESPGQVFVEPEATPRCIQDSNVCRLWYKPDITFRMPKVNVMVMFRTPLVCNSPQNAVLAALWTELVQEFCNSFSYVASMAGLHCYFHANNKAIELTVSGYNHKVDVLIEHVIETIKQIPEKTTGPVFERVVHKLEQRYLAFMMGSPYRRAMNAADLCLEADKWNVEDRLELLQQRALSPTDVIYFHQQLLNSFFLEAFVHGNAEPSTALKWINGIVDAFQPKALMHHQSHRVIELPAGHTLHAFPCHNPDDNNNSVLSYYQVGAVDLKEVATLKLTQHLMQEPAFFQLRTSEQLGYLVHTSVKTSGEHVKGLMVLIQSESFNPDHLDERIEAFLPLFRNLIVDMTAEEFEKNSLAVRQGLVEKPKNLGEESSRHWDVISNKTYHFNRLKDLAELVKEVTREEVLQLLDKYILPSPVRRKLSVRVYGASNREKVPDHNVVKEPKAFGRCQALFPLHHEVDISTMMME